MLQYIQEKMKSTFHGWYCKYLSAGGKEVLLKSVAMEMPVSLQENSSIATEKLQRSFSLIFCYDYCNIFAIINIRYSFVTVSLQIYCKMSTITDVVIFRY